MKVDCPVKTMAHLASESVAEPYDEPAGIESLEWLFALEHHGSEEEMASLTETAKPVRLLLVDRVCRRVPLTLPLMHRRTPSAQCVPTQRQAR